MYPLYHIGPLELPSYGSIILVGILLGIGLMILHKKIYNYALVDFILAGILSLIGLFVGAKVFFAISVIPELLQYKDVVKENVGSTILYMLSGYVFYGGLIGVLIALKIFCRYMEYSFLEFMNVVAPVIPFIHALGRIGCFLGGCCYGIAYHGPFSVQFPHNEFVEGLETTPRFPIQLLECFINLLIFAVLFYYSSKKRKPGSMLGAYLISYAIVRFSLEFLRGDVSRGFFFYLSTSQWISLLLLPLGIWILYHKFPEKIPEKVDSEENN